MPSSRCCSLSPARSVVRKCRNLSEHEQSNSKEEPSEEKKKRKKRAEWCKLLLHLTFAMTFRHSQEVQNVKKKKIVLLSWKLQRFDLSSFSAGEDINDLIEENFDDSKNILFSS